MKGLEISRRFFFECGLPLIEEEFPDHRNKIAAGLLGTGSEVFGADDDISKDHEWGPRFTVLMTPRDYQEIGSALEVVLSQGLPTEFLGFSREGWVAFPCVHGVYSIPQYIAHRTGGFSRPPKDVQAWQRVSEKDLFTLTCGTLFYDPLGEATRGIQAFSYYPEQVWLKRLTESLVRLSSMENIPRSMERGDDVAAQLYMGHVLEESLKFCHLVNRKYAPYRKWLYWSFRQLPQLAPEILPFIEQAVSAPKLSDRQDAIIQITEEIQKGLKREGMIPAEHEGDLFSCAHALYQRLDEGSKKCFNGHIHDAWGSYQCRECELV